MTSDLKERLKADALAPSGEILDPELAFDAPRPQLKKEQFIDRAVKRPRKMGNSACVFALSIFLITNFLLSFYSPFSFDSYRFPYHGWAWWAFNDLRGNNELHNVAVMGSSLMVSAVAGVDANYLQKTLDLSQYHKCTYLDQQLHTRFGGLFNSFNLSVPGQMPSDAYLALKAMVNTANRPDVVIYGVAPRDFIDSTMSSPSDTEPFRYLRRLVSIDEVAPAVFRTPFARLDWFLQRYFYMYSYSLDMQLQARDQWESFINKTVERPFSKKPFTWWDRIKLIPDFMPGEIVPLAVTTGPIGEEEARHRWLDNTREYMERYKKPDKHTYNTQFYFLEQLAAFCRRERMELVLVNMPITTYNIHLLGPPKYIQYSQRLRALAFKENLRLIDLCQPSNYAQNDFHDSVHLNAYGGKKLFDQLINSLSQDARLSTALHLAGQELKRHQAVAARAPLNPIH